MSDSAPRLVVLAALGRNPVSGAARPNRDDLLALEIARRLAGDVGLLHAGDGAEDALADYLAYGASRLEIVPIGAGADVAQTLAARLAGFELILAGSRSEGGEGSGLVPYLVARQLGLPIVDRALDVVLAQGGAEVTQFLPKGQRRRVRVRLPAVIAVHPMAPVVPRYAYARRRAGAIARPPTGPAAAPRPGPWQVEPVARNPVRLRAIETRAGHVRMRAAVSTETRGGTVVTAGTPADKAEAIIAYLRQYRLIDW